MTDSATIYNDHGQAMNVSVSYGTLSIEMRPISVPGWMGCESRSVERLDDGAVIYGEWQECGGRISTDGDRECGGGFWSTVVAALKGR